MTSEITEMEAVIQQDDFVEMLDLLDVEIAFLNEELSDINKIEEMSKSDIIDKHTRMVLKMKTRKLIEMISTDLCNASM